MSSLEKKRLGHLRRLLRQAKHRGDVEGAAALRWAIYTLEQETNSAEALRWVVAVMAKVLPPSADFSDIGTSAEQAQRKVDRMKDMLPELHNQEDRAIAENLVKSAAALVEAMKYSVP